MFEHVTLFLYVKDVAASTAYYRALFGADPVQAVPGFAMFVLPSGLPFALWSADDIQPPPVALPGGNEIGFKVEGLKDVDTTFADWKGRGMNIAMPPTDAGFGRSFVVVDPDGHRLRVYAMH